MAIKITCPHCKRGMLVPEQLAGKRGRCKACQHILTVPKLPESNPPPAEPAKPEAPSPVDVEAEAAALFTDELKPPEPAEVKTIDFNCPYCDEPIQLSADLAGKRGQCPECKNIIKVPDLVKKDPKDWRKVETRLPSGARLPDEPAPEGAWASTAVRKVGQQSLVEAGVVPKTQPPRTLWQKIRWPVLGVGLLLVLSVGGLMGYRWWARRAIEHLVQEALAFADSAEVEATTKAALSVAASEYYLLSGTAHPDPRTGRSTPPAVAANNQFGKALTALRSASQGDERDAVLADLALALVELGGDKADIDQERRLPWDKTQQLLVATLGQIQNGEARLLALRAVAQRLGERGQNVRILPLTNQVYPPTDAEKTADKAAALAAVGLDFLKANDRPSAEKAAREALNLYEDKKPPPLRAEVIALARLLDMKNVPAAGDNDDDDKGNAHVGEVAALARQGNWDKARRRASADDFDEVVQFHARLAIAAAAVDAQMSNTADIEAALKMARELGDDAELSWSLLRLTQLALATALPHDRVQALADHIGNTAVRGRAQLAVLRARLAQMNQSIEDTAADKIDAKTLARSLAALALARHNTRLGANYAGVVQSWPQPLKAFGSLGVALGLQDRAK